MSVRNIWLVAKVLILISGAILFGASDFDQTIFYNKLEIQNIAFDHKSIDIVRDSGEICIKNQDKSIHVGLSNSLVRCCCDEIGGGRCCGDAQECEGAIPGCQCK